MSEQSNNIVDGDESIEELEQWMTEYQEKYEADEPDSDLDEETTDDSNQADEQLEAEKTADSVPVEVEQSENGEQQVIESKNGGHPIPYSVLTESREETKRVKAEKEALQQRIKELEANNQQVESIKQDSEKTKRLVNALNKQLTDMGVEPQDLPENKVMSEEKIAKLAEDYPEFSDVFYGINNELKALAKNQTNQTVAPEPPKPKPQVEATTTQQEVDRERGMQIIQSIPELDKMLQAGGDEWQRAITLDQQIIDTPEWKGRSQKERFEYVTQEIVKQRNAAQQASASQAAQQAIDNASNRLPNSPSEIGNSNKHEPSSSEALDKASDDELVAIMAGMSEFEVNALLRSR